MNITELAQREKFEVWAHSQKLSLAYGDCGYAFSSTEMAWRAWMASSAELVEKLDKAQDSGKVFQQSFFRQSLMYDVVAEAYEEAKEQIAKDVEIKARLCRESNSLFDRLRVAEKRIAELEAQNTVASLPGGFSIEESRSLQADLVRSHISKALSGEKMKSADKNADLQWIHSVIVRAAWFVKASVEATAGIKVEAE